LAEAFIPLTPEQRFPTGAIRPSHRTEINIEVPEAGEMIVPDLALKASQTEE
jgi:hypothetical protein